MEYKDSKIQYGFRIERKDETPKYVNQVHGNTVYEIKSDFREAPLPDADGVLTHEPNLELRVYTADCVPVLIHTHSLEGPIAAIHSGWKGTLKDIVTVGLSRFTQFKDKLEIIIGPSIKSCCYEIQEDFIEAFEQSGKRIRSRVEERNAKLYFDVADYIAEKLRSQLSPHQINQGWNHCTYCGGFPSYRRQKNTDPRICAWIKKGPF